MRRAIYIPKACDYNKGMGRTQGGPGDRPMTYRILNTRTRRIVAAGLTLDDARRFCTARPGCIFLP